MIKNFIASSSCKPGKSKCGDSSFAGNLIINGEECMLLLVADGVSTAPKDWLASQSALDFILAEIQNSTKAIPDVFSDAISTANKQIYMGIEGTKGMLTTLAAVLIHPGKEKIWFFNVGDSRIYGLKNNKWIQLTADDSISKSFNSKNKMVLQNGNLLKSTFLTNAIGFSSEINVSLKELSLNEYDALILASDGFYGLYDFDEYAIKLSFAAQLEKTTLIIQSEILSEITDDASFAVIRLPNKERIDLKSLMLNNTEIKNISTIAVLNVLETELIQAINESETAYLEFLMNIIEYKKLYFSKLKMIELLDLMIAQKNERQIIEKMTSIIRKL
jgi:serine/threonine protein phosphatase PrpC